VGVILWAPLSIGKFRVSQLKNLAKLESNPSNWVRFKEISNRNRCCSNASSVIQDKRLLEIQECYRFIKEQVMAAWPQVTKPPTQSLLTYQHPWYSPITSQLHKIMRSQRLLINSSSDIWRIYFGKYLSPEEKSSEAMRKTVGLSHYS